MFRRHFFDRLFHFAAKGIRVAIEKQRRRPSFADECFQDFIGPTPADDQASAFRFEIFGE
jgi:hypothetical protein